MKEFHHTCLLGKLAEALAADLNTLPECSRFNCRPIGIRTPERCTALGRFRGKIGLANRDEFRNSLEDLVIDNPKKIILDLSETTFSKGAVGILLHFAAASHGLNRRLYLYQPSAQLRALLKELKLASFFSYLNTEEDIIATVAL